MKVNVDYTPTAESVLAKWKKNKLEEALKKYGASDVHRKSFNLKLDE